MGNFAAKAYAKMRHSNSLAPGRHKHRREIARNTTRPGTPERQKAMFDARGGW